ncbi:mitochondrial carrier domain-containing protein [Lophiotrema nucula]|uniref:Mitochondrial carrier domain-containing protein n=1 Tax=Lophiotrema nucula TaxID=690887 RepID=A0A6A5Z3F7_9PLEO|nr:mitochondrial carrier domain-containing protein [Lophiotrema nucula]
MTYVYNSQLDAFSIYHVSREDSRPSAIGPALPALGHATSGAAGTAISKLLLYPLDLVITRLQVQKQFRTDDRDADYKSIQDAIEKIYRKEGGVKAFYSGVLQDTLKGVADSFLFFLAYTYLTTQLRQKRQDSNGSRRLSVLDEIGVGVVAGAISKFFTTPVQNIVTRKQTAAMVAARDPTSSVVPGLSAKDIALQIRHEKGLQGFWSGYSASLILTLNPSITFLLHKVLLRMVVPQSRRSDPGARLTFLLAAVSKATASTVTYPFQLAKTRAQVSSQKPTAASGPTSETQKQEDISQSRAVQARQRTIFSTILRIAQTEGLQGLYHGLGGEVLKGFFSHGITMLLKDRIHVAIINLYYLILKSMKKYPSSEELAKMASEQASGVYEQGKEHAGGAYAKSVEFAGNAAEKAQDAMTSGREQAEGWFEKGKEAASNASKQVQDAISGDKKD